MSYQAVEWALERAPMLTTGAGKKDTTARFVLVALAEHADRRAPRPRAHPSLARLRFTTGLDMKTAQRALSRLAAGRLITAVGKVGDGVTEWELHTDVARPDSDRDELEAEVQDHRDRDRRRKQEARASGRNAPDSGPESGAQSPDVRTQDPGQGEVSGAQNPDSGALRPDVRDAEPARTGHGTGQEPVNARTRARAGDDATTGLLPGLLVSVPDRSKTATTSDPDFEAEFAEWWNAYPHKRGRRTDAYRAYVKARKGRKVYATDPTRKAATAEQLLKAVHLFAQDMRRTRRPVDKIPHGSTFLNGDEGSGYLERADQAAQNPRVVNGPSYGEAWG